MVCNKIKQKKKKPGFNLDKNFTKHSNLYNQFKEKNVKQRNEGSDRLEMHSTDPISVLMRI